MALTRNLMYYCYPRRAGQRWRNSVNHLLSRWPIFTGRKLVTIAIDDCCDDPAAVIDAFPDDDIEVRVVENLIDPARAAFRGMQGGLQEAAHFGRALRELETTDPGTITLYAHSKGCTHADASAPSHAWCDAMAQACLDYPALIDCALEAGNIAGAFRVHSGWQFAGYHDWHFAGTWYWFRNSRALELGSRDCEPHFFGTEAWPGVFPISESVCLFADNSSSAVLYQPDYWRSTVAPALRVWHRNLRKAGAVPIA